VAGVSQLDAGGDTGGARFIAVAGGKAGAGGGPGDAANVPVDACSHGGNL
jgi:hypothetical protein